MAKFYESISDTLRQFIEEQHMFFVASAPLSAEGHVNLSPKGMDSLRVLSPNRVAYIDLIGSGNETSAHLRENGRITLMWCAFKGKPDIVRLYGKGRAVLPSDPEWTELSLLFPNYINARQIITAEIQMVQTSCGYAVPALIKRASFHSICLAARDMFLAPLSRVTASLERLEALGVTSCYSMVNVERADDRAKAFYTSLGFASGDIMHLKLR